MDASNVVANAVAELVANAGRSSPDLQVTIRIMQQLAARNLITEDEVDTLLDGFVSGSLSAAEWKEIARAALALEQQP